MDSLRSLRMAGACLALAAFTGGLTWAKTWDGGAGTMNWTDPNNWNPDGVRSPATM